MNTLKKNDKQNAKIKLTTALVVPTILLFLLLSTILFFSISSITRLTLKRYVYNDILDKQQDMFDGVSIALDEVNLLYSRMVLNSDFQTVLEDQTLTIQERNALYLTLMDTVGVDEELFVDVIVYYNDNYFSISGHESFITETFVSDVFASPKLLEYDGVETKEDTSFLIVGKKMRNFPLVSGDGGVFMLLDETALRTFYDSIAEDVGYSFIADKELYIYSNTNGENIGSKLYLFDEAITTIPDEREYKIGGTDLIVIINESSDLSSRYNAPWYIISVLNADVIYQDIYALTRYNLVIAIVVGIFSLVISIRLAKRITGPFEKMIDGLHRFTDTGDIPLQSDSYFIKEVEELDKTYNEMMERIKDLIVTKELNAEAKRELELYALQMQINPHFLYNTLDAISWMAKIKNQPEIEKLVIALAEFFRISLHKGDKFIKIREELELINNYLQIEVIRFPEQLSISYEVDKEVLEIETLKLVLQPIVENAIKHGIGESGRQGELTIKVFQEEDFILYQVVDNGLGFIPPKDLLKRDAKDIKKGYGLQNVDDRIKLEYGEDCGISIESQVNKGTIVTIKFRPKP